jgi:hypothetical protein
MIDVDIARIDFLSMGFPPVSRLHFLCLRSTIEKVGSICYFDFRRENPSVVQLVITGKATGKTGRSPLTDVKFPRLCTAREAFCCGGSYAVAANCDSRWGSLGFVTRTRSQMSFVICSPLRRQAGCQKPGTRRQPQGGGL